MKCIFLTYEAEIAPSSSVGIGSGCHASKIFYHTFNKHP